MSREEVSADQAMIALMIATAALIFSVIALTVVEMERRRLARVLHREAERIRDVTLAVVKADAARGGEMARLPRQ